MFAFLLGLVFINMFKIEGWYLFLIAAMFMAGLPDIDIETSAFGKKAKPLSFMINLLFGHRGLFHSFIFAIFLFFVIDIFGGKVMSAGVLLGYSSHLILDGLTKQGIMPFIPFSRLKIKGFIRSGGLLDLFLFIVFFGLSGYVLFSFL
jgi:inner membrane protein